MSYSGILDFIRGNKNEKVDAENIALNENGQAVAAHTHIIPTDHLRKCPVCDKPLFSIRTHTIAWSEVPGMFASPSNLFACGSQDCSVYGLVRVMS